MLKLGKVVMSPAAIERMIEAETDFVELLARHKSGDWGTVCPEDWRANDWAAKNGERILSAYQLSTGKVIWIITERDRSVTTMLRPEDY